MDEHHEGEAPAGPSSAVRSRFWAGLNHASDRQSADRDDDQGSTSTRRTRAGPLPEHPSPPHVGTNGPDPRAPLRLASVVRADGRGTR